MSLSEKRLIYCKCLYASHKGHHLTLQLCVVKVSRLSKPLDRLISEFPPFILLEFDVFTLDDYDQIPLELFSFYPLELHVVLHAPQESS